MTTNSLSVAPSIHGPTDFDILNRHTTPRKMPGRDSYGSVAEDHSPLPARMALEACAAFASALSIAPAVSIVDQAIVSNASGLEPLVPSVINGIKTLFTSPATFAKQPSFLLIFGIYCGTYGVANSIDALCERSQRPAAIPTFIGSSAVNVTLCVLKDRAIARMFGTGVPKPMSNLSMGLFATRDGMTILASFSLIGVISQVRRQEEIVYA